MKMIEYIKEMIYKLFSDKSIKEALNIEVAISDEMQSKIKQWYDMYSGKAEWLSENIHSIRLEQSIVREFSNIVLNEMTVDITNEKLNDIFNTALRDINMHFQEGLSSGAMVIKPLGEDKVQFLSQNSFIPLEYDSRGRLLKVIFPDFKTIGNDYYTRLEMHSIDKDKGLTIQNKAYHSKSKSYLGREIPLDIIDEWANLAAEVTYPDMNRPAFGYYRNPINNTIDGSKVGVSIYDSATELIRMTDIQFGRLDWEFESAERAIHVSEGAIKNNGTISKLNERIYKSVDIEQGVGEDLFKEFSPNLRQNDFINGLDEYKREIEFIVGLSYGDISNPQNVDKTATEIKSAKARKYNTVTAIQENLKDCLEDLAYALAFFNTMATVPYEFICNFKDSILTDEDAERKSDLQDVSIGAMQLYEYRMKWYGESEEQAKAVLSDNKVEVVE